MYDSSVMCARNTKNGSPAPHDHYGEVVPLRRWVGLLLAVLLAGIVYVLLGLRGVDQDPAASLTRSGRVVASVGSAMAVLWITEAIPIPATALLPIVAFPLLTHGHISVKQATAPYAHEVIFLFLGGFILAQAVQRWGLHRRFALHTIALIGSRPKRLVAGFMAAGALLSMWISNTATTIMMLPIALSIVEVLRDAESAHESNGPSHGAPAIDRFATSLLLGIAYASSIGGMGTLIGTAPNALLAAFLADEYNLSISFARWMGLALPLVVVFVPAAWFVLTFLVFPVRIRGADQRDALHRKMRELGPMSGPEWSVLIVFVLTAILWITRPWLGSVELSDGVRPLAGLSDTGIAMAAALLLFALPARRAGRFVSLLSWTDAVRLPWGVLLLFGGGLSLASAIQNTGVADFIGKSVSGWHTLPPWALVAVVTAVIVFLTELTSNTATTATFLPILAAAAAGMGLDPLMLAVPATLAASCAFMMPVATPPNAIVFSSGEVTVPQMCKAGLWLNILAIALILGVMYAVIVPQLGIDIAGR